MDPREERIFMTWVVIANAVECDIYKRIDKGKDLQEITKLHHPRGRLSNQDLKEGKPGRSFESGPKSYQRHTKETEVNPHNQEVTLFVRQIAGFLEHNRNTHNFNNLILIAEPHFLGLLNKNLNEKLLKMVTFSINKDLVKEELEKVIAEIEEHERLAG